MMSQTDHATSPEGGRTRQILGARFFTGPLAEAVALAMKGGLVLAPSGPGLGVDLVKSPDYRKAVVAADLVLIDSGALVLFWRLFTGEWVRRNSGLMFLRAVLAQSGLKRHGAIFWVMPSEGEQRRNLAWLEAQGFSITADDCYIAPVYGSGEIGDEELLKKVENRRPQVVVVAIGGGVQEQLGHFLRQRLSYRPGIFCLGAAIAFLSGGQARIPPWADALMLGWLLRILYSPRRYAKRYWEAWALFPLLWRYRENMPPLRG